MLSELLLNAVSEGEVKHGSTYKLLHNILWV